MFSWTLTLLTPPIRRRRWWRWRGERERERTLDSRHWWGDIPLRKTTCCPIPPWSRDLCACVWESERERESYKKESNGTIESRVKGTYPFMYRRWWGQKRQSTINHLPTLVRAHGWLKDCFDIFYLETVKFENLSNHPSLLEGNCVLKWKSSQFHLTMISWGFLHEITLISNKRCDCLDFYHPLLVFL